MCHLLRHLCCPPTLSHRHQMLSVLNGMISLGRCHRGINDKGHQGDVSHGTEAQ